MAEPDHRSGVHPGVGGVFERDHGNACGDSRAGSDHAEPRGQECFGGEPDAAVAGSVATRGGPNLQRPTDQRSGAADAALGTVAGGVAAGARGTEPGTAPTPDSPAGPQFSSAFYNPTPPRANS